MPTLSFSADTPLPFAAPPLASSRQRAVMPGALLVVPEVKSLSLAKVCSLLGSAKRVQMLRLFCQYEWLPVTYLARQLRVTRTVASQHVAVMRKMKVLERGLTRLYRLNPALRPPPGQDYVDFGHLRLPVRDGLPATEEQRAV